MKAEIEKGLNIINYISLIIFIIALILFLLGYIVEPFVTYKSVPLLYEIYGPIIFLMIFFYIIFGWYVILPIIINIFIIFNKFKSVKRNILHYLSLLIHLIILIYLIYYWIEGYKYSVWP